MKKQAILDRLDEDIERAKKTQGEEAAARLVGLSELLFGTDEEDLGKFVDDHFDEMKNLPYSGAAIRGFSKETNDKSLASAFGFSGDKAVDDMFGNGRKNWKNYDAKTIARIGYDQGYENPEEFRKLLETEQAKYDENKREENAAKMNENIKRAREKVVQDELYPKITEDPLGWLTAGIAKTMFSNITEAARKDALEGKGKDNLVDFIAEHPKDVVADALITGTSMIPLGGMTARGLAKTGRLGQVIGESIWQGANTAAGEAYGAAEHNKEFDYTAPLESMMLGGMFELSGKEVGDMFKAGFGGKSKTVKEGANVIEDAFVNKKELAEDYVKGLEEKSKKFNTTDNPGRADYKRTKDNYKEKPITEDDVKAAREARSLFDYAETGKRPQVENKEMIDLSSLDDIKYAMRDMTDKEISELMSKHPVINEFSGSKMRDAAGGKARTVGKFLITNGPNIAKGGYKGARFFRTNEDDRKNQELKRLQRLEKEFEKGNVPKNDKDPNWEAYREWIKKHPERFYASIR